MADELLFKSRDELVDFLFHEVQTQAAFTASICTRLAAMTFALARKTGSNPDELFDDMQTATNDTAGRNFVRSGINCINEANPKRGEGLFRVMRGTLDSVSKEIPQLWTYPENLKHRPS